MTTPTFHKVLIANRGEIARRIIATCRRMGLGTVAVYSEADRHAQHVKEADEAVWIGPAASAESYLLGERIIEAAKLTGAGAIHPGYGFLSENADFATACQESGLIFVGPTPAAIVAMGSKIEAKALMREHGVPVVPGYDGAAQDTPTLAEQARLIGFPVLLKASAGGGGKGMRIVHSDEGLTDAIEGARREGISAFGDGRLLIEKYITSPRHVEFQILGDSHGKVIHVLERECSIQRRHQKVIEEAPCAALDDDLRQRMSEAAVNAGQALGYQSAGTVEFILGGNGAFYFLEVNTRLQVEHPVTEMITGLDLVDWQLRIAMGEALTLQQEAIVARGHSIECRLYAEDPANDFLPATGRLNDWFIDTDGIEGLRVDSAVESGDEVSMHYDPMIAKVITWGRDRAEATRRMLRALETAAVHGVTTNRRLLVELLRHPAWNAGDLSTHFIQNHFPDNESRADAPSDAVIQAALVAATAAYATHLETDGTRSPGTLPLRWRNNPWRPARRQWRLGEREYTVNWAPTGDGFVMGLDEETAGWAVRDFVGTGPAVTFEFDDGQARRRLSARVAPSAVGATGGGVYDGRVGVHVDGFDLDLHHVSPFPDHDAADEASGCTAPMPGKVISVLVEVGAAVTAGQSLITLEAMKMEHTIAAPTDGVVAELFVEVGDSVDADAVLIRFEDVAD